MKNIFSLLAIVTVMSSVTTYAAADIDCLANCAQQGYASRYCQERCSDDANPGMTQQQTIRQVDPQCMNDCTRSGHPDDYCSKSCLY